MRTFLIVFIFLIAVTCLAGEIPAPPPLPDEPAGEQDYLQKIYVNWNKLEVLSGPSVTFNPDGLKKGKKGEVIIFANDDTNKWYLEVNIDGSTTWRGVELTNTP